MMLESDQPCRRCARTNNSTLKHDGMQIKGMIPRDQVMTSIRSDLSGVPLAAGPHNGLVVVNGVRIRYAAYRFFDGTINVGRITPLR